MKRWLWMMAAVAVLAWSAGVYCPAADAPKKDAGETKKDPAPDDTKKAEAKKPPSAPEIIAEGLKRWEKVDTFKATFSRRERLEGETSLGEKQTIFLRERKKPFSIYMRWIDGPGKNREVAYVEGQNGGKFKATLGGALGWIVVDKDPKDPEVSKYSRHTVLEAGMGNLLHKLMQQFELAKKDVISVYKGEEVVNGRPCYKFFRFLPQKKEYYCWKLELLIDKEYNLPVVVRMYDWEKKLFEEFSYGDMVFNPPYTDDHFKIGATKD
jgi:hypothetical protein